MEQDTRAAWWTVAGWERREKPASYLTMSTEGWVEALHKAGYSSLTKTGKITGDEYEPLVVQIWHHLDRHLLIDVWDPEHQIAVAFVSADDREAFMISAFPGIAANCAAARSGDSIERLAKIAAAYVRHGIGKETIDEDGEISLDDRRREESRLRSNKVG